MGDYFGFRCRNAGELSRKEHAPRRSAIVRAIPRGSRRLRGRYLERAYLSALTADPRYLALREDAQASMAAIAKQLARRADHEGGWTRPTRALLAEQAGCSISTWKVRRAQLQAWGYLGLVSPGCKRWHGDRTRYDAAVYVVCVPARGWRRKHPAAPGLLPRSTSRPPTGVRRTLVSLPAPARGAGSGAACGRAVSGRPAPHPRQRAGRSGGALPGAVAAALRRGPGKTITDGWVTHLSVPWLAAGYSAADLAFAIDHDQDGDQHRYLPETVLDPVAWLRWRLSHWLAPGQAALLLPGRVRGRYRKPLFAWKTARPVPSRSQASAAAAAELRARQDADRAERAALRAAASPPPPGWAAAAIAAARAASGPPPVPRREAETTGIEPAAPGPGP